LNPNTAGDGIKPCPVSAPYLLLDWNRKGGQSASAWRKTDARNTT
jgi:hypothetical protein